MSNLEHFAAGAGEHAHMLGVSAPMNPNSEMDKVYAAEEDWQRDDKTADAPLTLGAARVFATKMLSHPSLDSISGIDDLRKTFNPATDVVFTKKLWWQDKHGKPQSAGAMATTANDWEGKANRVLINKNFAKEAKKKIPTGILTHELAHVIANIATSPDSGHNWAHARVHLHIVKNMLGNNSYKLLKKHYDVHGVDYGD